MAGLRRRSAPRVAAAEARCAWCGAVPIRPEDVIVHARRSGPGLLEFRCPSCTEVNLRPLDGDDVRVLGALGIRARRGPAPFELTEPRTGPPIGWDDLIELHEALEREAA
jgi:hypothetical protein